MDKTNSTLGMLTVTAVLVLAACGGGDSGAGGSGSSASSSSSVASSSVSSSSATSSSVSSSSSSVVSSSSSSTATSSSSSSVVATLPSQLFDTASWKLTLPIGPTATSATEIGSDLTSAERTEMSNYSHPSYYYVVGGNAVRFTAPINGTRTSSNTKFARTELREIYSPSAPGYIAASGSTKDVWACGNTASTARGMYIEQAVQGATTVTKKLAIGQIHDNTNDNLMVAYTGGKITASFNNNTSTVTLDSAYTFGDKMSLDIAVSSSALMTVTYKNITQNKAQVVETKQMSGVAGTGCFFKAGNYIQDCINKSVSYTDAAGNTNQTNSACDKATTLANVNETAVNDIYKLVLR